MAVELQPVMHSVHRRTVRLMDQLHFSQERTMHEETYIQCMESVLPDGVASNSVDPGSCLKRASRDPFSTFGDVELPR